MRRMIPGKDWHRPLTSIVAATLAYKRAVRRVHTALLLVAALTLLALQTVTTQAAFQEGTTTVEPEAASGSYPPGSIDGAKNPGLIPDEFAYEMFFIAVAEPEGAAPEELARARSKLAQALLDEDDTAALLNALTEFRKRSDLISTQLAEINLRSPIAPPSSPDGLLIAELHQQRKQLTRDTINLLAARLSEDGLVKLHEHLQREKRGMIMFPMAQPSGD